MPGQNCVASSSQEAELVAQSSLYLLDGEEAHTSRRQFDCEWHAVKLRADMCNGGCILSVRAKALELLVARSTKRVIAA